MQQLQQQQNQFQYIIKTPKYIENKTSDSTLVGVIDASGSMKQCWQYVSKFWNKYTAETQSKHLITFSSRAKSHIDCINIKDDLSMYGGYKTNISAAFDMLNFKIKLDISAKKITVLFVSDGADSNPELLEKKLQEIKIEALKNQKTINFISVAVGSNFPTFIAMQLRDMYHSGDSSVPPIFLIEDVLDESQWESNFDQISQFLEHESNLQLLIPVKSVPWSKETSMETYENQWVMSQENKIVIQHKNQNVEEIKTEIISIFDMVQILKFWVNKLSLESLKQKVQQNAQIALEIVNKWQSGKHPQSPSELNFEQNSSKNSSKKISFYQKMMKKCGSEMEKQFNYLLKEIKGFCEKNILENLSETEAAKRLAIGTQMGRFHNKAMQMRGISVEDYQSALKQFQQIYSNTKISEESDQDFSVISMQNMKDILLERDFMEGLKMCPSQYDLVENLPLIGHALKIQRSNGSMINPYLVKVVGMAKHHSVIDTISIQSAENNNLVLKTGNDEVEIVNAVLPLFGPKDADLKPILNSKLFNILMTFNVMNNADTLYPNAYMALLSNTFLYLITCEDDNSWRQQNLKSLYFTLKMVYSEQNWFKIYCEQLINNPRIAVVTESPEINTKCEDLAKPIFILYYLQQEKLVNEYQTIQILNAIFSDFYGRFYPSTASMLEFYDFKQEGLITVDDIAKIIINQYEYTQGFSSSSVFCDWIYEQTQKNLSKREKKTPVFDITKASDLYQMQSEEQCKYTVKKFKKMQLFFVPDHKEQIINQNNIICWIQHGSKYHNSLERAKNEPLLNSEQYIDIMEKQFNRKMENEIFQIVRNNLNHKFAQSRDFGVKRFKYIRNDQAALFMTFLKYKIAENQ